MLYTWNLIPHSIMHNFKPQAVNISVAMRVVVGHVCVAQLQVVKVKVVRGVK